MTLADAVTFWASQEGYLLVDQDDTGPRYFGYLEKTGAWRILKDTVSGATRTYRYAQGTSGYDTNWTNRATVSYDYPVVAFA
ncbi:MAG: hypothetical protein Q8R78_03290 [Candidatus Omnitrophota bacterium]|nr:hypothetical protein [Candidatus Omnitrophota bacterium]